MSALRYFAPVLAVIVLGMAALLIAAGNVQHETVELATVYDSPASPQYIVDGKAIGDELQYPDHPAGCEIVALQNALEAFGIEKSFDDTFALFDKSDSDFVNAWWGDPDTEGAAYPPAMVEAVERAGLYARDMTGETLEGIADAVETHGGVAIIWYTTDLEPPRWTGWKVDGWEMYANEHVAVVYHMAGDMLYISDPIRGLTAMEVGEFNELWEACGSMGVAVYEKQ